MAGRLQQQRRYNFSNRKDPCEVKGDLSYVHCSASWEKAGTSKKQQGKWLDGLLVHTFYRCMAGMACIKEPETRRFRAVENTRVYYVLYQESISLDDRCVLVPRTHKIHRTDLLLTSLTIPCSIHVVNVQWVQAGYKALACPAITLCHLRQETRHI